MLLFFVATTALIAFTGGFAVACVMAAAGNADRRTVDEFERRQRALGGGRRA